MPEEKCLGAHCVCVTLPNSSIPTQSMQIIVCFSELRRAFKLEKCDVFMDLIILHCVDNERLLISHCLSEVNG